MQRLLYGILSSAVIISALYWLIPSEGSLTEDTAFPQEPISAKKPASAPTVPTHPRTSPPLNSFSDKTPPAESLGHRHPLTHTLISARKGSRPWESRTPAARQAEWVDLDTSLLTPTPTLRVGDSLVIAVLGDPPITTSIAQVQTWGNGTVAVTGNLQDDAHSTVYLAYTGKVARALIQDSANQKTYLIRYDTEAESHYTLEIDRDASDIRNCANDLHEMTPNHTCEGDDCLHTQHITSQALADEAAGEPVAPAPASPQAAPTASVTLDLLVVYTPAALAQEGNNVANIQNNISIAVQTGNTHLANSQTYTQFNLVHTELVAYTEVDPSTDLNNLTDGAGAFATAHTLRDTHQADFVSAFLDTPTGGLGWVPKTYHRPDQAFNIVRVQQTDWTPTLIHELGHNMGNGHSASQTASPGPGGIYPFSAGWQWADAASSATIGYCTVMTYENFDNNAGNGNEYSRIEYFSNPNITHNGIPIGSATTGDAARVIRDGRFEMANYRGAAVIPIDTINTFPYSHGFETNLDVFYQDTTDTHTWIGTQSGATLQNPTGPSSAHGGDYYAVVYGNDGTAEYFNRTANLLGRVNLSEHENTTLGFHYHLYDGGFGHMGSLHVDVSTNGGVDWTNSVWSISGNQGNLWHAASVNLSAYNGQSIVLRFRAVTGSNFLTDIAIDSINLTADTLVTFTNWLSTQYPGLADSTSSGDPDGDGIPNLMEYALNSAPDSANPSVLPQVAITGGDTLSLTYRKNKRASDLSYTVQSSPDLVTWTDRGTGSKISDLDADTELWQATQAINGEPRLFLRLKVLR